MKSGTIYKVKDGTYRFRYMLNGKRHSKNIKAETLSEAKKVSNKFIKDINNEIVVDKYNNNITFTQLAQMWFDNYYKPNFTPEVVKNAKISLNAKILDKIGNLKIYQITPMVINDLINEWKSEISPRTRKRLSNGTIKKLYNYL